MQEGKPRRLVLLAALVRSLRQTWRLLGSGLGVAVSDLVLAVVAQRVPSMFL
jgi:class 3 adenylate cyclase